MYQLWFHLLVNTQKANVKTTNTPANKESECWSDVIKIHSMQHMSAYQEYIYKIIYIHYRIYIQLQYVYN